jgi:NhaP-type Na+/H+ or K+/H+ antiporter
MKLFVGWFGPRGLASVVFALLAMENLDGNTGAIDVAVATIGLTVLASVLLHGLTAQPLVARYAARRAADEGAPVRATVPVRHLVRPATASQRRDEPV